MMHQIIVTTQLMAKKLFFSIIRRNKNYGIFVFVKHTFNVDLSRKKYCDNLYKEFMSANKYL